MKRLENILLKFVGVMIAAIAFMPGLTSCDDDTTTDSTTFALYYSSMTDISPTMSGTIASPTYIGAAPSGFSITGVRFGDDDQPYTGDSFIIDETTGAVTISNTDGLQIGKYKISVSCMAGGNTYSFQDAIIVNFMKAVPDGITVEPAELQVEYADLNTEDATITLPTAQVKTDGEHISITGYEISSIRKGEQIIENFPNKLFDISGTGEISIVKGNQNIEIGTYVLTLKLNTAVAGSDSELGLFADAVRINVISKPLSLTYSPDEDLLEEDVSIETEYIGKEPVLKGSLEGIDYSIASVIPATDKISVDPTTGKIIVAKGHGFRNGDSYTVSVLVKNQFCEEGVVFENVFDLNVVEFIEPIANFSYPETEIKQAVRIDVQKNPGFEGGGNLAFAFSEEDKTKYEGILTLDEKTGEISAPKYNTLEVGEYDVHVIATNNKAPEGVEAVLKLNIVENENYFTTISYGNNLGEGQTELEGEEYDNQFRFTGTGGANNKKFTPKPLDLKGTGQTVKWSIKTGKNIGPDASSPTTINEQTGEITVNGIQNNHVSFVLVTAEVGTGEEAIARTVPFFISIYNGTNSGNVLYTPFVLRVNPKDGGSSATPFINSENVKCLDFRRNFTFINIDGVNSEGIPFVSNPKDMGKDNKDHFLGSMWSLYGTTNYGTKDPVSYFSNRNDLSKALLYVDNANGYRVVVNPNKWYNDGYADGVFFGQMTFSTEEANVNSGTQIFPMVVWFDKDYAKK